MLGGSQTKSLAVKTPLAIFTISLYLLAIALGSKHTKDIFFKVFFSFDLFFL